MKRLLAIAILCNAACLAQFTIVTGTVHDPNGLPYAFGNISAQLNVPGGTGATICSTGLPYFPPATPTGFDKNGHFSLSIANNASICPAATTWTFTVSSGTGTVYPAFGTGPQTFSVNALTISGSSQDISSNLNAAATALTLTVAASFPTQAADTMTANATGGTAAPTGVPFPNTGTNGCAGATNALIYNTTTHTLGCNTISTGTGNINGTITSPFVPVANGPNSLTNSALEDDGTKLFSNTEPMQVTSTAAQGNIMQHNIPAAGTCNTGSSSVTGTLPFLSGNCYSQISFTGLDIGGNSGTGDTLGLMARAGQATSTASTMALLVAIVGESLSTGTVGSGGNWGGAFYGESSNSPNAVPLNGGLFAKGFNNSSSIVTITNNNGGDFQTGLSSGTNTNDYTLHVESPQVPTGTTMTNHVGLQIEDQTVASGGSNANPISINQLGTAPNNFAGKVNTPASTTSTAGFRLPPGVAPTVPQDGDCWITSAGLFCRIAGVTVGPYTASAGGGGALSAITAAVAANTINNGNNPQLWNFSQTTSNQAAFTFSENVASSGSGDKLFALNTLPGSTAIPLTVIDSLTGSQNLSDVQILPFWNTTANVDAGFLMNVNNTASGAGSLLMDLQFNGTQEMTVRKDGLLSTVGLTTTSSDATFGGISPWIDITAPLYGAKGDGELVKQASSSGATITLGGSGARFAPGDCNSGGGCTGATNKVIGFQGGGLGSGTVIGTVSTNTTGGNLGILGSATQYFYQAESIIDSGTLPSLTINGVVQPAVNGWSLPTTEASITTPANTTASISIGTPSGVATGATGIRYYFSGVDGNGSKEEVLQTPGTVAFGTVTAGGSGCVPQGAVTIGAPNQSGGIQATAIETCNAGAAQSIIITNAGTGYTANPSCALPGAGATCTLTVGLLCGSQSAKNFHDLACDTSAGATVQSVSLVGPLVHTAAEFRSVITGYTSATVATIADTPPTAISLTSCNGGVCWASWGTENTAAANLAQNACPIGLTQGTSTGCDIYFPPTGSVNAPTGRYLFLNGLQIYQNGESVHSVWMAPALNNAGTTLWTGDRPTAAVITLGDAYGVQIGSLTTNVHGVSVANFAAEDELIGNSWAPLAILGQIYITSDHIRVTNFTGENYTTGYAFIAANVQVVKLNDYWASPTKTGPRLADGVSDLQQTGGQFSGNLDTTGLGNAVWISNNPLSTLSTLGNNRFDDVTFRDFYQGLMRVTDSIQNRINGGKFENITLSGSSGGNQTGCSGACWGSLIREEGILPSRCSNNAVTNVGATRLQNLVDAPASLITGGTPCNQGSIEFANASVVSGSACVQANCRANDTTFDFWLGDSAPAVSQTNFTSSGMAFGPEALATSGTLTLNCANGNFHYVRGLSAAMTLNGPSNCEDGQDIVVEICNDSTGNRQFTWGANYQGATNINYSANACTIEKFVYDRTNGVAKREQINVTNSRYDQTGIASGTNVSSTTIVNNNVNKIAQQYTVDIALNQGPTFCTTNTTNGTSVSIKWTDSGTVQHTYTTTVMAYTAASPPAFLSDRTLTFFAAAGSTVLVSTTSAACTSGSTTYDLHVAVNPVSSQ